MVITTADIYRQLLDLTQAVGQLNGSISTLGAKVAVLDDHETRLRILERARWPLPALAIIVSSAALIVPLITKH